MKILIVEDEFLIAMTLEDTLLGAGYEVVGIADCYEQAIALADEAKPDFALLDVQIIGPKNGVDVAAALKQRGIYCMFMTGNCPTDKVKGLAIACLHKPYPERDLLAALDAARHVANGNTPGQIPQTMHLL